MSLFHSIDIGLNKGHHGEKRLALRVARASLPRSSLPHLEVVSHKDLVTIVDDDEKDEKEKCEVKQEEERRSLIGIYIPTTRHLELVRL